MMKNIIFNADDFGLTKGCNEGIVTGIKKGVITSTTVMINMPYARKGLEILSEMKFKSAGIHLTLTCGEPTLTPEEVPSLVNNENKFYKRRNQLFPQMDLEEVEKELGNQIELFLDTGFKPSHLDSHHHIHMYDGIREIVTKLAKEYDLPMRYANEETKLYLKKNNIITTDGFSMDFYGDNATRETIEKTLIDFKGNTIEFMVHPAIVDDRLINISSYNTNREKELEILTDKNLINWLKEHNFNLIGFHQLKETFNE